MSKGLARAALAKRIQKLVENVRLPYMDAPDGAQRVPVVYEQRAPNTGTDLDQVPCIKVQIGAPTRQTEDNRSAAVSIIFVTYADDGVQGYRDTENLIEMVETDLISNPWLDGGQFKLTGPWETDITDDKFPVFFGGIGCNVQLPAIEEIIGPDGRNIDEVI